MSIDIRAAVRWAANGRPFETFVSALEQLEPRANLLRVLTYHRVDEVAAHPELSPRALSATPDGFALQMRFLAENFDVMSMCELLEAKRNGHRLPQRATLITFDDAYSDFEQHAWPILQQHNLPATLFVPTAYPDHPERRFWWDRLYHAVMHSQASTYELDPFGSVRLNTPKDRESIYRRLSDYTESLVQQAADEFVNQVCDVFAPPEADGSVLSWDQLRSLASRNLTLAPHTRSHPLLNRLSAADARDEILGSWQDLEHQIGETPRVFAYPGGAITSDVVSILRSNGFEVAFTTRRGIVDWDQSDRLLLNRINVGYRCPLPLWRGQLLGVTRRLTGS